VTSLAEKLLATAAALVSLVVALGGDVSPAAGGGDPCAGQMPVLRGGRGVHVIRAGADVPRARHLELGDRVRVPPGRRLQVRWRGNGYALRGAHASVECARVLARPAGLRERILVLRLAAGAARIEHRAPAAAVLLTPEAVVVARRPGSTLVVRSRSRHRTTVVPREQRVELADLELQRVRVNVWPPEQGLMDRRGLRLDTYPFAVSAEQRRARRGDGLVPFWSDGRSCSVGCRAPGARPGWPLKPFHGQHALRSGLNELRPANPHLGIDIQALDYQRVYPMSSGRVHVIAAGGHDERVQVGQFIYWHINHRVHEGQLVRAYRTTLGVVKRYYHHLHLSAVAGSTYLNPLRPGGRNLSPWSDTEPPVIGPPRILRGGHVTVAAFDPQSYVVRIRNVTPVLAPAAVAWRLFDAHGRQLTPLEWALRGSQHLPDGLRRLVYAPGARNPGFRCFTHHRICIPTWRYRLAGGLTPTLAPFTSRPGRYRLAAYAWDWAGNTSARDLWFGAGGGARIAGPRPRFGRLHPQPDVE
jgi:hypothetical protein